MLSLSAASVEKHITAIFQKLDLEHDELGNRRVLAAIAHLESADGGSGHGAAASPANDNSQTGQIR